MRDWLHRVRLYFWRCPADGETPPDTKFYRIFNDACIGICCLLVCACAAGIGAWLAYEQIKTWP